MKKIAIITPNDRDFRMYVLQQTVTEKDTEYIHISNLNSAYGIKVNDYISITNSVKMPNHNEIVKTIQDQIV